MKHTITETEKKKILSIDGLDSRMERTEETIGELGYRRIESTQSKQKENRFFKNELRLRILRTIIRDLTFRSSEYWMERKKRVGLKKYLKI